MARQALTKGSAAFKLEGIAELKANVAKVLDRTSAAKLKDVYMDAARVFYQEAYADAPVVSGKFRGSFFISPGDPTKADALFIVDYKKCRYAHIVEYGSSRHAPHGTIRRAVNSARPLIARTIAEGLQQALDDVLPV